MLRPSHHRRMADGLGSLRNRVESSLRREFPDTGWMVSLGQGEGSAPALHVVAPHWPSDLEDLRGDERVLWTVGTVHGWKTGGASTPTP